MIEVGDTVWTRNQMLMVEAWNPKTGEGQGEDDEFLTSLTRREEVKIVALPDDNSGEGNFTCEKKNGIQFYMTRDEFETVDDSGPPIAGYSCLPYPRS